MRTFRLPRFAMGNVALTATLALTLVLGSAFTNVGVTSVLADAKPDKMGVDKPDKPGKPDKGTKDAGPDKPDKGSPNGPMSAGGPKNGVG